jgi:hypothetical protein
MSSQVTMRKMMNTVVLSSVSRPYDFEGTNIHLSLKACSHLVLGVMLSEVLAMNLDAALD